MASMIPRVRAEEGIDSIRNTNSDPGERIANLLTTYTDDETVGKNYLANYKAEQALNQELNNGR